MTAPSATTLVITTAAQPGAVALLQLHGPAAAHLLRQLTAQPHWPPARLRLADFAGIDRGLAVLLHQNWAQLMPHGGPRVVRKLVDHLLDLGAVYEPQPDALTAYPEADSAIEADALAAIAHAASPAAIDLLAAQPALWRERLITHASPLSAAEQNEILARSRLWDRLIDPATVVVVAKPNVGKSTLTNRMLGRSASIVADLPGTTRDWVAGLAELLPPPTTDSRQTAASAVAVHWMDTPGLRDTNDPIERQAIHLARHVLRDAQVLIAMRDPTTDWPSGDDLPRQPDLWAINKIDMTVANEPPAPGDATSPHQPLPISAERDWGLPALQQAVLRVLELDRLQSPALWAFSPTLRLAMQGRAENLPAYVTPISR
jgi:tRNA modification GTPase